MDWGEGRGDVEGLANVSCFGQELVEVTVSRVRIEPLSRPENSFGAWLSLTIGRRQVRSSENVIEEKRRAAG